MTFRQEIELQIELQEQANKPKVRYHDPTDLYCSMTVIRKPVKKGVRRDD